MTAEPARLSRESVHAVLRAARYAIRAYPDPVGELIDHELRAYLDTGHQLPPTALPERLLGTLAAAQTDEPGTTTPDHNIALPAPYRKGTPLLWEHSNPTDR